MDKITPIVKVGSKVELIPLNAKLHHWKYLKGTIESIDKKSQTVTVFLSRNFRKYSHTKLLIVPISNVKEISNQEFSRVSFVDIGDRVRVIEGKHKGKVAVVRGSHQTFEDKSGDFESEESFSARTLGQFVAAYLDLKDGNDSHLTVTLDEIELITELEYSQTLIEGKNKQMLLF